jgi:hypothetical protein
MARKWFCKDATGVNQDIKRHRQTEIELMKELENAEDEITKKSLINLLNMLRDSKADVVNKMGRRK